jgi:hypothetical protein
MHEGYPRAALGSPYQPTRPLNLRFGTGQLASRAISNSTSSLNSDNNSITIAASLELLLIQKNARNHDPDSHARTSDLTVCGNRHSLSPSPCLRRKFQAQMALYMQIGRPVSKQQVPAEANLHSALSRSSSADIVMFLGSFSFWERRTICTWMVP